jgi:hypothetical protein
MGALTLKTFPFELRGWDIEKFESIDPTDGFGSNTRVYISKNQIVQIEPDYNIHTFNTWITDKGRQFFDGIFETWDTKEVVLEKQNSKNYFWLKILKSLAQTLYVLDHCNKQKSKNYFFTIVFENISLEILSMLVILSQNYNFIQLRRAENFKAKNDFESDFQLNAASSKDKLLSSTLSLIISNNPRYEGYYLNLNLRQRFYKGNFKCLTIGSFIDLTFPLTFLGSNLKILKHISEGNHLICQDLKFSKNPILIVNSEMLKRHDGENILQMLKTLKYTNLFSKTWNGLNMLNSSLSDTGNKTLTVFTPLNAKSLINFSTLYFINVSTNNISNLKKIVELKLLNISIKPSDSQISRKLFLDQNNALNNNILFFNHIAKNEKYYHISNNIFYENEETFLNTEGYYKRTTKLLNRKSAKSNWQILRKFMKYFKSKINFLDKKNNNSLFFNLKKKSQYKTFINFQFYAVQTLTSLNFHLKVQTKPFSIYNQHNNFRLKSSKIKNTKLKYWLDDFFSGGKDEYSHKSLILTNCSRILRAESKNFK